jgi:MscS family membrane protein
VTRLVVFLSILTTSLFAPIQCEPVRADDVAQSTPTAAPPVVLPDQDLQSPRAAVATFLRSMNPNDGDIEIDQAIKVLDVSDIPDLVRSERAKEVAVKLYATLDHIGFTPGKAPSSSSVEAIQIADVGDRAIYLERSGPNWRFSKVTVAEIPEIFREIEAKISKRDMRMLAGASKTWLTVRTYIPERLKNKTILIEDWQWLAGLLAVALLLLLHRVILHACRWVIVSVLAPRLGLPPNLNLQPLGRPVGVVVVATALQLFLLTLDLPVDVYTTSVAWLSTIRTVAIVVLGIFLVDIVGERLSARAAKTRSTVDDILYPLVQKMAWLLVVLLGAAQILSVHGVNVAGLVAGLGLGGLAFALAAKDTIENIFGSIAILIDQPFRVGDAINVGGVSGTVEQIGLRSTRLRTPDNSLISMPNSKVIAGHVDNLGARPFMRTKIILNLAYDTPPESISAICAGIRDLVQAHPDCKRNSVAVFLNEFNLSSLGVLVQFNLQTKDWLHEQASKDQIFLAILTLLKKLNVRLTSPPQEVKVTQSSETPEASATETSSEEAIRLAGEISGSWKRAKS